VTDASNLPAVPPTTTVRFDTSNVRTLRTFAFLIDAVIIAILWWIAGFIMVALAFQTYGAAFGLAPLVSLIGVFYSGFTVSGRGMGTWGMRAMGLKVTDMQGNRVGFIIAAGHALIFWLATGTSSGLLTLLVLGISFFNADKRAGHDLLTGVIISKR